MTQDRFLRRMTIFVVTFTGGMALVISTSGGLFLAAPATPQFPRPAGAGPTDTEHVVPLGGGAGIGPGRGGRLEADDLAIVGNRPVTWRRLTAEWAADAPEPSRDGGVLLRRLTGARLVFFPQPSDENPVPASSESAPGVTILSGRDALVRRREQGPVSTHLEGDCVATRLFEGGEMFALFTDALDFRQEERGGGRPEASVLETDRPVRIRMGGAELTGTGLVYDGTAGKSGGRCSVRVLRDVQCTANAGILRNIRCSDAATLDSLDQRTRDGRQPWRATFRDDVKADDGLSTMTAEQVVVDFVRTGAADRKGGADATEVRSFLATGGVTIEGRDPRVPSHVETETLRAFTEDALTDVQVLEGHPVLRFDGRPSAGGAAAARAQFELRCDGTVTVRRRRSAAATNSPADVTFACEGPSVLTERDAASGDTLAELRSPRITVETKSDALGRMTPTIFRAENGADGRFSGFAGHADKITVTAPRADEAGGPRRVALIGSPVVTCLVAEGQSPLGGTEGAGRLLLSSPGRIDAELFPEPAAGAARTGRRVAVRTNGGMTARKLLSDGDEPAWELLAGDGDASVAWDGGVESMHATGGARLRGRDGATRGGILTGDRIDIERAPTAAGTPAKDAWKRLDTRVRAAPGAPATATYGDGDDSRQNVIRAFELSQTADGSVLTATGAAHATLHRSAAARGLEADADEIRATVARDVDGRTTLTSLACGGDVTLRDGTQQVRGSRVTYDPLIGLAEARGTPALLVRSADGRALTDASFTSYASGPLIRAEFDPAAKGAESFRRATLPSGGEIVAYATGSKDAPVHDRVTTTARGQIDITRTTAVCIREVVSVWEQRREPGGPWLSSTRIDCERMDMTFEEGATGKPSSAVRSFVAVGTPENPASLKARSPAGDREAFALAERIELLPGTTRFRLSCPSDRTTVYIHYITAGRRSRCDAVTFDYQTHEWFDLERERTVE